MNAPHLYWTRGLKDRSTTKLAARSNFLTQSARVQLACRPTAYAL